jgi:type VI secretion system secreted protein VgrG
MGNQTNTVEMGNQSNVVKMGNVDVKVNLGAISVEAMQSITLKSDKARSRLTRWASR